MFDFVKIKSMNVGKDTIIYPEFLVKKSKDLMIRGKSFYAVWDDDTGYWTQNEDIVQEKIDKEISKYYYELNNEKAKCKYLGNFSSNKWSEWLKYCKSLPDNYKELDSKITFQNSEIKKSDYITKCLPYPIEKGPAKAYNELMDILYDEDEKKKLEWAVGAVLTGDSKKIQKFIVLYGPPGSGKSTWLNILQKLVEGYYSVFESKELASSTSAFALEAFKNNPLVAIQHDGDLSRVEDNTKLNSIVSHETMLVNEKFKNKYSITLNSFIFMGTNKPVKITDAKSGIIRRLIDVNPSGRKVNTNRFIELTSQINFELGAIAHHCIEVYKQMGINYYDNYMPMSMMSTTNDFYNFVEDNFDFFTIDFPDYISLNTVWLRYKEYCLDANIQYQLPKRIFKDELKNYFKNFDERKYNERNVYSEFIKEKFDYKPMEPVIDNNIVTWLNLDKEESLFDEIFKDCKAQYANENETPNKAWNKCSTTLKELDTTKIHYVRPPENLIIIDFDLKDSDGNKCLEYNLREASKWPETYAELSKSGEGIHLAYYYDGDPNELSRIYNDDIEIKLFTGFGALRRKLTKCNNIEISILNTGLPLKEKKMVSEEIIKSEKKLREMIIRNLRKEIHSNTAPSISFIYQLLEDAYNNGIMYDVRDMRSDIQQFAMSSSHQADKCMKLVSKMKFCSVEQAESIRDDENKPLGIFDVEVAPNHFLIVAKKIGKNNKPIILLDPTPTEVEKLFKNMRLIGFNNRNYDNHMCYARQLGYSPEQIFELSKRLVNDGDRSVLFGPAYGTSYTDIWDCMSSVNRSVGGLKKWEIRMGSTHSEWPYDWDQPIPDDKIQEWIKYCVNDVLETEKLWFWEEFIPDWESRQILTAISGLTENDTTNQHTTRIIVGTDPNPQSKFVYTYLNTIYPGYKFNKYGIPNEEYNEGTKIVSGKSIYKGEDPGEGGYVYAEPGIHYKVGLLDVESMHPSSIIKLNMFGDLYTLRFKNLKDLRLSIKHKKFDEAKELLKTIVVNNDDYKELVKYLDDPKKAKGLANALKTAINSVYGLTSAKFPNKLRDPRNEDNICAKYGALFMINLKYEVQKRGYTVVHIKTDSIKIAEADKEIIQFVNDYGKEYGFKFNHEASYEKMCIVNDSVYVAKYASKDFCMERYGYIPEENEDKEYKWTTTGTQFQVPYVFKKLFSHEPIKFKDLCETKSVTSALYLDFNENLGPDEHDYRFIGKVGQFCPVKPGYGGGILLRKQDEGKYAAATGTKKQTKPKDGEPNVYYWMESEMVRQLNQYNMDSSVDNEINSMIDRSYYDYLVDEAVETINKYGDAEAFMS